MNDGVCVKGEIVSYKSTADGSLRVTIELNELESSHFHDGFGIHALVALARLSEESSERPA